MKRFLKKTAIGLLLFFVLIAAVSAIIATFFEDQVGEKLLTEINKNLKSELKIEEFDLSLMSGFPNMSVNLRQVNLADTNGGTLLEADNLAFRFGFFSLFGSNINIKSVVAQHGALLVHTDKNGKGNYDVFKSSNAKNSSGSDLSLSLQEAKLEDIEVIYMNEQTKQESRFFAENALFSGQFSADKFAMQSVANIQSAFVDMDGARFLAGKEINYDADINVDLEKGNYTFEDVEVRVESNIFKIDGDIKGVKAGSDFDLVIINEDGNLESILQLLPKEYLESVGDLSSTGNFLFKTTIIGLLSESKNPAINVDFGLEDGTIKSSQLKNALKDVSFAANFTNGEDKNNKTSVFNIRNFKGYFNRELTEMKFTLADLDDPRIDLKVDGSIPVASVYGYLGSDAVTNGDGEIEINNLKLKGMYEDMISPNRISRVDVSGEIEFDDAELTINKETLIIDKGKLVLADNDWKIQGIKLEGAGSEMSFNGDIYNLIPVLFADSLNSKNAELEFKARLDADELDLDRLMSITTMQVEEDEVEKAVYDSLSVAQNVERERLSNFLKGTFDVNIATFNYHKIEGEDFEGSLAFDNNEVLLDGDVETMDGSMNLEGTAYLEEKPRLKANIICKDINVNEFFRQAENFGQEFIKAENIKGDLTSSISITAYWDEEGNFLNDKLRVLAGISISDGELLRLKLLEDFSTFVKVKDLRRIKFTNMENWLEVRRGKLNLPVMFMQSNALNLTVSGIHSFEHDIDYNIKVNAGQVLLNRFKAHDRTLKPNKAQKKGWFNLYYKIKGDLEDYAIVNSKREVQTDFIKSDNRKREIRKQLEKEFGKIKLLDGEAAKWRDKKAIPEYPEANNAKVDNTRLNTKPRVTSPFKTTPKIEESDEEEEPEFLFEEEEGEGEGR